MQKKKKRIIKMKFMKKVLVIFLLIFSCFPIPGTRAAISNLEVNEGFYSETLLSDGKVDIWANPAPEGMIFDHWVGDSYLIDDPYSFHTSMEYPKEPSQINATYKPLLANWDIETNVSCEIFSGTEVYYYLPSNNTGVVFIFHGARRGAGAADWMAPDWMDGHFMPGSLQLINRIVLRGYGFIACESLDRVNCEWDDKPIIFNTDIQNIKSIITNFTNRGLIQNDDPKFGLGHSNGGYFVCRASEYFNFTGQIISCAGGLNLVRSSKTPTYWNLAVNDIYTDFNPTAAGYYESLILNGKFARFFMNQPTPVHPMQFSYINGISSANSSEIYDAFVNAHLIDEYGYGDASLTSVDPILDAIPEKYNFRKNSITNLCVISVANHIFYSKNIHNVLNFFDSHNPHKSTFALTSNVDFCGDFQLNWAAVNGEYQPTYYDEDGKFNLIWSESAEADNYSIYRSQDYITEVDETLICMAYQNATTPYPINMSQFQGDFYFLTVAHSKSGITLSNCIHAQIKEPSPSDVISYGYFFLVFTAVPIIILLTFRKKKFK